MRRTRGRGGGGGVRRLEDCTIKLEAAVLDYKADALRPHTLDAINLHLFFLCVCVCEEKKRRETEKWRGGGSGKSRTGGRKVRRGQNGDQSESKKLSRSLGLSLPLCGA